jgi:hypothetical protein
MPLYVLPSLRSVLMAPAEMAYQPHPQQTARYQVNPLVHPQVRRRQEPLLNPLHQRVQQ